MPVAVNLRKVDRMGVTHLVDKGHLFDQIGVNYSGAEATRVQSYRSQSRNLTMVARMLHDFQTADVLDVACGFGVTTLAVAAHNPRSITSIDPSETLTSLAKLIMQNDDDITAWYEQHDGHRLLGESFHQTVDYIAALRNGFKECLFHEQGKQPSILQAGLMEFDLAAQYDVVTLNNGLHWVVSQLRQQEVDPTASETMRAVLVKALRKIRILMKKGGVFVFQSPKIFVEFVEPELEVHFTKHLAQAHPVLNILNAKVREIFETEQGIQRTVGTSPPFIYRLREMSEVAQESGFRLAETIHMEETLLSDDVLGYFKLLIPINLGDIDVPMAEKVRVVNEAAARIKPEASRLPQNHYIPDHWHIFALFAD